MDVPAATGPLRLNLGAGSKSLAGFTNVGLEPHHDIYADLRDLSPIESNSADEAIAIHVAEHVARWEAPDMFREWFRVLKPGGTLAVELPELIRCCKNILAGRADQEGRWGVFGNPTLKDPMMLHAWCWTKDELVSELRAAGFIKVKETSPQFHGKRAHRDMRVECRKPE